MIESLKRKYELELDTLKVNGVRGISAEEWESWKSHPITVRFFNQVYFEFMTRSLALGLGSGIDFDSNDKTALEYAHQSGMNDALMSVMETKP